MRVLIVTPMLKIYHFIIFIILCCIGISDADAQYANAEISSGGFSFIPAFTDINPNLIIRAGTGNKSLMSAHMIGNIRLNSMNPRGFIFITRAKIIDKQFKLTAGIHLPAIQIDEEFHVDTFFAQELIASYKLSDHWSLSSMYLHGKGRNNDLEINLMTFNAQFSYKRFLFLTQLYLLDLDQTYGLAENITYKLTKKIDIRGFANSTISNGDFKWTIGLLRHF